MAKKNFDYQFEDIRRESTPVSATGFGDMVEEPENPDEAFVEVDLNEDDVSKAVSAANNDDDAIASAGKEGNTEKTGKEQRREALQARRKAEQVETDLEEGRREFAAEVNSLKKEVAELKASNVVGEIDDEYNDQETELTAQMEQAMEDGDSKAQSTINSKLIALNSERQAKTAAAEASVSIIEDLGAEQQLADQRPASKRAAQFIRDNESWWSDPDHDETVVYAKKLDRKLVDMGFDPESDAYWTRFNHNFDKKFPETRIPDPDDIDIDLELDGGKRGGRKRSPVSQPGGAGKARRTDRGNDGKGNSKVRLTAAHKANMVRFHMDPSDPEQCAAYAREVQATNQRETERRAS